MTSILRIGTKDRAAITVISPPGFIGPPVSIEFDASVSETHTGSAEATQFPVEEGADISDHIRRLPEELSINIITTNSPILILASVQAKPIVGFGNNKTRAENTYEFLKAVKDDGTLVNFHTTLRNYKNMYIQTLSCTRDVTTNNIVNINLIIREIIIAITDQVAAPEIKPAGRQGKNDQGKKNKRSPSKAKAKADPVGTRLARFAGMPGATP